MITKEQCILLFNDIISDYDKTKYDVVYCGYLKSELTLFKKGCQTQEQLTQKYNHLQQIKQQNVQATNN